MVCVQKYGHYFLFALAVAFLLYFFLYGQGVLKESEQVVLETAHLKELKPHVHENGASAADQSHHVYMLSPVYTAPSDMWISHLSFELFNASDTVVHHVSLLDHSQPHQTCASLPFKQLFILAQDTMHHPFMEFPAGTGMLVKKGDRIQLSAMIHNPEPPLGPGETYHNVYGRLTLKLRPESERNGLKEIHPYLLHLDDEPCVIREPDQSDAYVFAVPSHTHNYVFSGTHQPNDPSILTFKNPSTIIYIGAHLHGWQGGKKLFVEKNSKEFLTFETRLSKDHSYRYDIPYYPTNLKMNAGDTLSIKALYENLSDVETRGAMGDLGIYYYEHEE